MDLTVEHFLCKNFRYLSSPVDQIGYLDTESMQVVECLEGGRT